MNAKINEILDVEGNSDAIKDKLSQYADIDELNSAFLFSLIYKNEKLLSDDESFITRSEDVSFDEKCPLHTFLTREGSYHIRIKPFTLALLALLFDREITGGFAALLLGLYGVDYATTKLSGFERCVAYKIKEERRIRLEQLIPLIHCSCTSFNNHCKHYDEKGNCNKWASMLNQTIESLISKKIIKEKEGFYEIIF